MIPGGSNDKSLADDRHKLIRTYIGWSLVGASDGVAALVSWLIYEYSNTVEQSVISGASNNGRLINVDTRNCYNCKVAQYLTSHEVILRAFTYALVTKLYKNRSNLHEENITTYSCVSPLHTHTHTHTHTLSHLAELLNFDSSFLSYLVDLSPTKQNLSCDHVSGWSHTVTQTIRHSTRSSIHTYIT